MGGDGGGFKAYNDHTWATDHNATTNPWLRLKGSRESNGGSALGSAAAREIGLQVARHEKRGAEPTRFWLRSGDDVTCLFESSELFDGSREGMAFKCSVQGQGYYDDAGVWDDPSAAAAAAALGVASGPVKRPRVFFDLAIAARPLGRLVISLWADKAPRAAADFQKLVLGGFGTSINAKNPQLLHYRNTKLARVIKPSADDEIKSGAGGEEPLTFAGASAAGPLDTAGVRALSEQTAQRTDSAICEGLARARTAPAELGVGALAANAAGLGGVTGKRAREDVSAAPGVAAAKGTRGHAVAARWQSLDALSGDDSDSD
ncbi:hypothetical protein T492DRAFT_948022 [Pavlovales sp. CCMP2436]|nr:hypothetical protein T492DRAFT_948022 [Pavlovales sp. CCMP2436]